MVTASSVKRSGAPSAKNLTVKPLGVLANFDWVKMAHDEAAKHELSSIMSYKIVWKLGLAPLTGMCGPPGAHSDVF